MKLLKLSIQRASWRTAAFNFFAILLAFGLCLQSAHGAGKPGGGGGGGTPPGNPAIAYLANDTQLKVMDADGANQKLVFKVSNGALWRTFWHPDGQRIFFHWSSSGSANDICRVSLDGTGFTRVVALSQPRIGSDADVSPVVSAHGLRRIAFTDSVVVGTSLRSHLFLVNEDGTGRAQVPLGSGNVSRPTWSPDGRHLAYDWGSHDGDKSGDGLRLLSFGEDSFGNVWIESDVLLLSDQNLGFYSVGSPSFSKTQFKIYFSGSGAPSYDPEYDLWALHLDDLLNPRPLGPATPGVWEFGVAGSADDSKIAYESLDNGTFGIYVANSDGSNPVLMPRPVIKGVVEKQRYPAFKR